MMTASPSKTNKPMTTRKSFMYFVLIFLVSLGTLFLTYQLFPQLEPDEYEYIKLPKNIEDAKGIGRVLSRYKDQYYYEVMAGVFVTYIFLQTFAIPGSIFLSILGGYLYRADVTLLLVCTCSAIGATFCFLLSLLVGRPLIAKYFPERTAQMQQKIQKHKDNLLYYMIFLRITPILPNWFINITSPVLQVPAKPFILGTFIGVAPPSFLAIQAGQALFTISQTSDALSANFILMNLAAAVISLLPVIYKKRLAEKYD